jgi:hypothetical protein
MYLPGCVNSSNCRIRDPSDIDSMNRFHSSHAALRSQFDVVAASRQETVKGSVRSVRGRKTKAFDKSIGVNAP